ncbi:MAG TPA: hypothetical protein VHE59_21050 [Mucilaginibacter sp.]|nr:hypothetical protein [Mucilaginibacter sp.]
MLPKTITIPFDRNNFLSSQKMIWLLSFSKIIRYYFLFTIVAIVLYATDVIIDNDQSVVGLSIIGGYFFYIVFLWAGLLEKFFKFMNRRKRIAKRFADESFISTYIFSEENLQYQDNEKLYQLNWSCFRPYVMKEDNILISSKDVDAVLFSFSRKELSDEDFQQIQSILDTRIGQKHNR